MFIKDIFETRIEEKIDPVIKVGERQDEQKLAAEIGSYVVTPTIEKYVDNFLEHYTDTFRTRTTENGVWISGYFGSGKSHLAKILALLIENPALAGIPAAKRFEARLPIQAPHRSSILRSLTRLGQCDSKVLAFNINTLADSKTTPLARILLSQYYQSRGYGSNFLYARVIEAELDRLGKLSDLHVAVEGLTHKPWADIQSNPNFYARALYKAACAVAPEVFQSPEEVAQALKNAEQGELYNVQFLVRTILDDLEAREKATGKPGRVAFVLDESGQWIEDDAGRLAQLQALVEESGDKGQGRIWVIVTTHEDLGTIYQNARALRGDMKKIEGRFRFKFSLTTENIELVLEDRIFRKTVAGKSEVIAAYNENPGVLRDLGELKNTSQRLPECSLERFTTFYPFLPYQIHLIPEIVKSLRSAGGRGEQLSGSTRTLLAITQDILRAGRRAYLRAPVSELVTFDEVFGNLAGEAEVSPDVRREMSRIEDVVPGATPLTRHVAEVLYLIHEISYIPRTIDNLARLQAEHTTDDLPTVINRIQPELDRLIKARLVAKIGEEFEFLTGERRTFEEEVADEMAGLKMQDLESGLANLVKSNPLGFTTVPYKGHEFPLRIFFDETPISKDGSVELRISSPLAALSGTKITDLENTSLRPGEQQTLLVLSDRIPGFDTHLKYYLAMKTVVDRWKGDPHKSEQAHTLAAERESVDLVKLRSSVVSDIQDGLRHCQIVFRGSSRAVFPKVNQTPAEALRAELSAFWPTLYSKYDKVPVRLINEQRAILDVLAGTRNLSSDVQELRLFDKSGQVDSNTPLLDAIRVFLATRQGRNERTLGHDLLSQFTAPPYGWDAGCVRVGIAALVRAGALRILIEKKAYTNPADGELQNALRASRNFDRVELVLEDTELDPDLLTEVRKVLIALTGNRKVDETPAALSTAFEAFGRDLLGQADQAAHWAEPARLPLPTPFVDGREALRDLLALANPLHRVQELSALRQDLPTYVQSIRTVSDFISRWGKSFGEMRDFAGDLQAVEYRLPTVGNCQSFLKDWQTAHSQALFCDPETWKDLQNARAVASLELDQTMNQWRAEARQLVQAVLDQIPHLHNVGEQADQSVQPEVIDILHDFLSNLEQETRPSHLVNALDRARQVIGRFNQAVAEERRKRQEKEAGAETPQPKKVYTIRLTDVTRSFHIQTEAQWNDMRERLDQSVKDALAKGNAVEII